MVEQRPSQWSALFSVATSILDHFESVQGYAPDWSFGGGTALMLQIDHRESHDVDLFVIDPQVLPFLNPETQGIPLMRMPDAYDGDGATSLKLSFAGLGEIDFICASNVTAAPTQQEEVGGRLVALETAAEIIAKKVYFRGARLQPRDMFDLAAVVEHFGQDYAIDALRQCGAERCGATLAQVENAKPDFVQPILSRLMYRPKNVHLTVNAQPMCLELLRKVVD